MTLRLKIERIKVRHLKTNNKNCYDSNILPQCLLKYSKKIYYKDKKKNQYLNLLEKHS